MATTLTERYINATTDSLPPDTQGDVRAELEASIADAVESRLDQGEDPATAERTVLTDLGDPVALAASYTDRPLHLLGPRYYLAWWRLLKLLLAIVPAVAVGGVALVQVIVGASIGEVIGQAISVGITATLHLVFWVTLIFVLIERSGADTGPDWNLDQLPEPRPTRSGRADVIASAVFAGLMIAAMLWDRFRGFVRIDGHDVDVQILHPQLWPWAILGLVGLLLVEVGLAAVAHARRGWTVGLAVANTALALVWVSAILTLLGNGLLVNPELMSLVFSGEGGAPETTRVVGILFVLSVIGASAWDIIDGWLKARRGAKHRRADADAAP
ncbi:permease prefix domain 1-containing protein [Brachybacterium sp. FME24]|uniref:permease prefix domain 1-containing protein n=1 Tax=Brachybacterium sp. FME24 TaxID=2742605 RepID=UPI001868942E|nr:permease prefix domain 1-containing protein [Brachybacterium sp. FME24]